MKIRLQDTFERRVFFCDERQGSMCIVLNNTKGHRNEIGQLSILRDRADTISPQDESEGIR